MAIENRGRQNAKLDPEKPAFLCDTHRIMCARRPNEYLMLGHDGMHPCAVCGATPTGYHWLRAKEEPAQPLDPEVVRLLDRLALLREGATELPWAYELVGDKSNDWCIGHCVDALGNAVAGEIVEPYNEATDEFGEKPVVVEPVCESSDNVMNAAFIVELVNAWPLLSSALRSRGGKP
jgi:hypothetical protein